MGKEDGVIVSEAQLCFSRGDFNRADFNVERFINMTRRRSNLDEIHNHLCLYLRIVQNSMVRGLSLVASCNRFCSSRAV